MSTQFCDGVKPLMVYLPLTISYIIIRNCCKAYMLGWAQCVDLYWVVRWCYYKKLLNNILQQSMASFLLNSADETMIISIVTSLKNSAPGPDNVRTHLIKIWSTL